MKLGNSTYCNLFKYKLGNGVKKREYEPGNQYKYDLFVIELGEAEKQGIMVNYTGWVMAADQRKCYLAKNITDNYKFDKDYELVIQRIEAQYNLKRCYFVGELGEI